MTAVVVAGGASTTLPAYGRYGDCPTCGYPVYRVEHVGCPLADRTVGDDANAG